MFVFVLPRFLDIYRYYGHSLPWTTELLLNINRFLSDYGLYLIFFIIMCLVTIWFYYRSEGGKHHLDNLILKVPLVKRLILLLYTARIARNMGIMLESGVPLLKAIDIASSVTGNEIFHQALQEARQAVKKGGHLSGALDRSGMFPELFCLYGRGWGRDGKINRDVVRCCPEF